jgi:hypothetical protein
MRNEGAEYVAIFWSSFWWLEIYPEFHDHLHEHHKCLADNHRLILFRLKR